MTENEAAGDGHRQYNLLKHPILSKSHLTAWEATEMTDFLMEIILHSFKGNYLLFESLLKLKLNSEPLLDDLLLRIFDYLVSWAAWLFKRFDHLG